MLIRTLAIAIAAAALAACGTDTDSSSAGLAEAHEQAVETIGDTTVVRTLSGSVWGTEATLVPEVSAGDLDGPEEYVFGTVGSMAVDDDRRVYVLDYQAQHVRVYDALLEGLPVPSNGFERPELMATRTMEGGMYAMISESVPFTPDFFWAVHPSGQVLTGFSTEYRLDLARDDGVLRIEREVAPVPVSDAEHSHHRDRLERSMRDIEPGWNWDGRIWVRLSTEGRRVANEDHDPDDPGSEPVSWEEATRFDVFEADGTYLGAVVAPDDFRSPPEPVFDGDFVWAVTRDELDVERVVRYRIVVGGG